MKRIRVMAALAGLGCSLGITAPAAATFLGITAQIKTIGFLDPFDPTREVAVIQFYARFDNPADQLISVFGEGNDEFRMETNAPNGFWNPWNGSSPPSQDLIDVYPEAEFDSYVTIGTKRNIIPEGPINGNDVDSPYEHPSQDHRTPGFDPLKAFSAPQFFSTFAGGVVAPTEIADAPGPPQNQDLPQIKTPQTLAGPDGLVLFAQLSITTTTNGVPQNDPDAIFSSIFGILNVGVREKFVGENIFREIRGIEFDFAVPAPGALALLGLAGLMGTRRRRK